MAPRPYSIALLCSFLLFHCAQRASAGPLFYGQVRARIEQQLGPEVPREGFLCRGEPICGVQLIPSYYQKRDYQPIWIDHLGLRPSAQTLAGVIETAAHREGLRPRTTTSLPSAISFTSWTMPPSRPIRTALPSGRIWTSC
jgi:hypothetical protein